MPGDVIGCCLDLDQGQITFYRNGESLGVAFNNVKHGENGVGIAYFPALSLSFGEKCYLNFGSRPFEYPVDNFLPLQIMSTKVSVTLAQAKYLVECVERLLTITTTDQQNAMEASQLLSVNS